LSTFIEKELDSGKADAHGGGGPFVCIFSMEEILLEVGFGDFIRSFSEELCNHAHGAGISFLGALAHAGKLKGLHGLGVVILGHGDSPFVVDVKDQRANGRRVTIKRTESLQTGWI
jgi:hypothetical protein